MVYDPYSDPLNTITDWPRASQRDASSLIGPFFAGWIAHMILFGVVQSQFSAYTSTEMYRRDPLRTKLFLWAVVLIDLAAVCVNGQEMYHYGTSQHRDVNSLFVVGRWDGVPNLLCCCVGMLVQLFLLKRASTLFASNLLLTYVFTGVVTFLIFMSWLAGCGAFAVGVMWSYGKLAQAKPFTYNNLTGTWLWSSLGVDATLCMSLVVLLRKRFDIRSRASPVRNLVRVSVETASYSTILSVAGAVMSVAFPQSSLRTANVPLAFTLPLPSLYALSMIVTLSSRNGRSPATVTGAVNLPELGLYAPGLRGIELGSDGLPSPGLRGSSGEREGSKRLTRFSGDDEKGADEHREHEDEEEEGDSAKGTGEKSSFEDSGGVAFGDLQTTAASGGGRRPSAVPSIWTAGSVLESESTAGHLRWA